MIGGAGGIDPGGRLDCDVCVVGAGIAGLALAAALVPSGARVLLLESGGERAGGPADALNAGTSDAPGYPFLAHRTRGFGGTSAIWTGACVPLDPADFEARPWVPLSGWPISAAALAPHVAEALALFGLPPEDPLAPRLAATAFASGDLAPKTVRYARPAALGPRLGRELAAAPGLRCLLDATATALVPDALATRIEAVEVRRPDGTDFTVRPRAVVLAAGGIENARLLLASTARAPAGTGNLHDTVGRWHMEHPIRTLGLLGLRGRSADALPFVDRARLGGALVQGTLGLSARRRAAEGLLDLHLRLYRYSAREERAAVVAGKRAIRERPLPAAIARYLAAHAPRLAPDVLPYLAWHGASGLAGFRGFDEVRLWALIEQEPDPANRITLSAERDRFGVPLPHVAWRESALMRDSIRRSLEILGQEFARAGLGPLRTGEEALAHLRRYDSPGYHPMGSTRMSDDPRRGVVDADCRVHGLANLFVAGSSVFPTGGAANPTLTLAALALRLAAHLPRVLGTL